MTDEVLYFLLDSLVFNTIEGLICFCFYNKAYGLNISKINIFINGFTLGVLILFSSIVSSGNLIIKQILIMSLYYFYFLIFTKCDKSSALIFSFGFIGYICVKEVLFFFIYFYIIGSIHFYSVESFVIFLISKAIDIFILEVFDLKIFAGGITRR